MTTTPNGDDDKPTSAPVEVTNEEPMPVVLMNHQIDHREAPRSSQPPVDTAAQTSARVIAATRHAEAETSRVDDQQRISGMWESTQRLIALAVVIDALFVVTALVLTPTIVAIVGGEANEAAKTAANGGLLFLTAVSNLVIGFYFGRTNHQRVGGATTPHEQDIGR